MACGCNKKAKPATTKTVAVNPSKNTNTYVSPKTGKKFTVSVNTGT